MSYVDGFVLAVPTAKKDDYRILAAKCAPIFIDHGAQHVMECWGDDIPDGKVTDFRMAVKATPEESVVFSWIVWPSKETRDAGMKAFMDDPRLKEMGDTPPFDGQRMIFGGFAPIVDEAKAA
ncbi:protein of unknown function DUF1428 [Ancylobacter novellus DSM 506]|uniref:DUF1428 domain-containing protein n=1 Tax=Ancylobacter novellus (strain ATCC 8093 / DSM 506 / JCM 20403 / CCM 1077 / IAM 12100 / NBRC 12443 / NCIMB 10456) TaxID=639283 RepID=D7A8V6_ANCN5|nr:DUF1428 domain-containing protein [Ancylobacter novellus]ADH90640.1 protein of unknown function DUF1428 [Ancylobacter novellus DSM 506]